MRWGFSPRLCVRAAYREFWTSRRTIAQAVSILPFPVVFGDLFLEIRSIDLNPLPRPKRRGSPPALSPHFDRFLDDS